MVSLGFRDFPRRSCESNNMPPYTIILSSLSEYPVFSTVLPTSLIELPWVSHYLFALHEEKQDHQDWVLHLLFLLVTLQYFLPSVSGMSVIPNLTGLPSWKKTGVIDTDSDSPIALLLLSRSSFYSLISRCKKQSWQTSFIWFLPPPTELESYSLSRVTTDEWPGCQLSRVLNYHFLSSLFVCFLLVIPLLVHSL